MTHPGMVSLIILYDIPLLTELQPGILYTTPLSRNGLPSNIENAAFLRIKLRVERTPDFFRPFIVIAQV